MLAARGHVLVCPEYDRTSLGYPARGSVRLKAISVLVHYYWSSKRLLGTTVRKEANCSMNLVWVLYKDDHLEIAATAYEASFADQPDCCNLTADIERPLLKTGFRSGRRNCRAADYKLALSSF